jgi:hypothetical protein
MNKIKLYNGSNEIKKDDMFLSYLFFFHSCIDEEKLNHAATTMCYIDYHCEYLCK